MTYVLPAVVSSEENTAPEISKVESSFWAEVVPIGEKNDKIIGYTRICKRGDFYKNSSAATQMSWELRIDFFPIIS